MINLRIHYNTKGFPTIASDFKLDVHTEALIPRTVCLWFRDNPDLEPNAILCLNNGQWLDVETIMTMGQPYYCDLCQTLYDGGYDFMTHITTSKCSRQFEPIEYKMQ